jgi:signal peptidase II
MNYNNKFKEKKNSFLKKENIFIFLIILFCVFLDRYTKNEVIINFSENVFFINNFINIDLIWNTGIGFGFLSTESSLIYNLVSALVGVVIVILCYFTIISEVTDKLIYAIIIGGAIGNFYDRLIFNAVPDFIDLHYDRYHWFTFNVADIFITLGIIIFLINEFLKINK